MSFAKIYKKASDDTSTSSIASLTLWSPHVLCFELFLSRLAVSSVKPQLAWEPTLGYGIKNSISEKTPKGLK